MLNSLVCLSWNETYSSLKYKPKGNQYLYMVWICKDNDFFATDKEDKI